jgi:hypothetical protein
MPDNASSGESLPSGSRPFAQPEPAARFRSYREYLAHLDRLPLSLHNQDYGEQLWLASFTGDGRFIKRYACILQEFSNLPATDVVGIKPDTTVLSPLQDSHSSDKF